MLKYNLYILAWLMIWLSNPSHADEYQQHLQQLRQKTQNITTLAAQIISKDQTKLNNAQSNITYQELFTLEQWLDEDRHLRLTQFHQTLSLALDTKSEIDSLAQYGFISPHKGGYQLNLKKMPQWAPTAKIFWFLVSNKAFDRAKTTLKRMGLSDEDIIQIDKHITDNNIYWTISEQKITKYTQIKHQLATIKNQSTRAAMAQKISEEIYIEEKLTWYRWVKDLLSNFSQVKQNILFEHGKSQLGYIIVFGTPISKQSLLKYAERIINGEIELIIETTAQQVENI